MQNQDAPKNEALARMTTWVASVADSINNPVAGISYAVALIESEMAVARATGAFRQEVVDDSLQRIRDRLCRLGEYVAKLVEVSRPAPLQPMPVQVAEVFHLALPPEAQLGRIDLECKVERGAESVTADPLQLEATIKALVNNGVEAAGGLGKPRPRIRVTAARDSRGNRPGVVIKVEDNGPGFSPMTIHKVVEPFFSTKEAAGGFGLAIAQRFAIAHGGTLELGTSSSLGGAEVSLFMPDSIVSSAPNGGLKHP